MNNERNGDHGTMITFEVGPQPDEDAEDEVLDAFIDSLEKDGVAQIRIEFR